MRDKITGRFLKESVKDRLLQKIDKQENGCWNWTGYRDKDGYGYSSLEPSKSIPAHRVSWTVFKGEIPEGLCVLHKCDNPPCVNPEHLFLGTQKDNVLDRVKKDRGVKGERVNTNKLSEGQVVLIRKIVSKNLVSRRFLSTALNVDYSTIGDIVNRRSWKYL